jgi:hypothetical protein
MPIPPKSIGPAPRRDRTVRAHHDDRNHASREHRPRSGRIGSRVVLKCGPLAPQPLTHPVRVMARALQSVWDPGTTHVVQESI